MNEKRFRQIYGTPRLNSLSDALDFCAKSGIGTNMKKSIKTRLTTSLPNAVLGANDGDEVLINAQIFTHEFWESFGVAAKGPLLSRLAVIVLNGIETHEAFHSMWSGRLNDEMTKFGVPDDIRHNQLFYAIFNLVEDMYIENRGDLTDDTSVYLEFVEVVHNVVTELPEALERLDAMLAELEELFNTHGMNKVLNTLPDGIWKSVTMTMLALNFYRSVDYRNDLGVQKALGTYVRTLLDGIMPVKDMHKIYPEDRIETALLILQYGLGSENRSVDYDDIRERLNMFVDQSENRDDMPSGVPSNEDFDELLEQFEKPEPSTLDMEEINKKVAQAVKTIKETEFSLKENSEDEEDDDVSQDEIVDGEEDEEDDDILSKSRKVKRFSGSARESYQEESLEDLIEKFNKVREESEKKLQSANPDTTDIGILYVDGMMPEFEYQDLVIQDDDIERLDNSMLESHKLKPSPAFAALPRYMRYDMARKPKAHHPRDYGSRISKRNLHRIATDNMIFRGKDGGRKRMPDKAQVILLLDDSGSTEMRFPAAGTDDLVPLWIQQTNAAWGAFNALRENNFPVAVYTHSTWSSDATYINCIASHNMPAGSKGVMTHKESEIKKRFLSRYAGRRYGNSDGPALMYVNTRWNPHHHGKKIMIVFSDGKPSYNSGVPMRPSELLKKTVEMIRNEGTTVWSVALTEVVVPNLDEYYGRDWNIRGFSSYLDTELAKLVRSFSPKA